MNRAERRGRPNGLGGDPEITPHELQQRAIALITAYADGMDDGELAGQIMGLAVEWSREVHEIQVLRRMCWVMGALVRTNVLAMRQWDASGDTMTSQEWLRAIALDRAMRGDS